MMNGQAALISALHHYSPHPSQQHFSIGDLGPAAASGGASAHHLQHHHLQQQVLASPGNLNSIGSFSLSSFAGPAPGACGTPAGAFHPLPLPFRPGPAAAAPPAAGLPANYNTAGQAAVAHQHQFVRSALLSPQRMAAYSAQQQQQDDELARFQELSNKYEPEATGPLVSDLLDSSAITTEYATADPVYQIKTASLPQSFAHYRTCRGDGHCGWRAVAYCYFEALVRTAEPYKFEEEVARLKSFRNIMTDGGFDEALYVDFAEEAWDLLHKLANVPVDTGLAIVLETFNDEHLSQAIFTYFKLLTSAWMKKYPAEYQPYLLSMSVQEYAQTKIEPTASEMEELGLSAMLAVLVTPAGLAAEVHYLDRSPGESINVIQYGWQDSERPAQKIRLLYRPGHYDILYKSEDLIVTKTVPAPASQPSQQQNVFVALQHASTETLHQRTAFHPGQALEIPGLSFYEPQQGGWAQNFGQYEMTSSPMSPAVISPRTAATPSYPGIPNVPVHDMYFQSTPMPQTTMANMGLPHHVAIDRDTPFRPSAWEYTLDMNHAPHQPFCTTAIFRNSHYNTAHFNNPDFEPEQWTPENDYATTDRPRKKSSHSG